MYTFKWYIVWVTYQEGIRWLRSKGTMHNVGLIKNTLTKNTYALIFISLKFEWMTLFCVLLSLLQCLKRIVLQSLTRYFVRVSDTGFVRHILYAHTCKRLTACANIFNANIQLCYYCTQQMGLCLVSFFGYFFIDWELKQCDSKR